MAEATKTLADSLLDDLDDLSDVEEETKQPVEEEGEEVAAHQVEGNTNDDEPSSVTHSINRSALEDPQLQTHLKEVRRIAEQKESSDKKSQEERENELVLRSNKFSSNLANAIAAAHRDLRLAYKPKFPELEELVVNPNQYKNAVRVIMNETDLTRVNDKLNEILNSNQIITISVAASTTAGRQLTGEELEHVSAIAAYMDELGRIQLELTEFVESRMQSLAPNVCALIGPSTAAKLMGLTGGLAQLSKIPACNLQVLGQVRENASSRAGMSGISTQRHAGVLAESGLVRECPSYLQKKALKAVAAKLALAARCDFVNVDTGRQRTDNAGLKFRQEILDKISHWQTPDKAQVLKALPKPDLTIKKRRGGKRMRRLKARFEETEMMKQANTRAFSTQAGEYGDDAMGLTLGMLDTYDAGGNLRKTTQKRSFGHANTKASRKRQNQMAASVSNSNGLMSSVVFTPVQGMELVDPEARKNKVREANQKWFGDNAGFQSALPKK